MESPSPFVLAESMPLRASKAVEDFEPSGSAVIIGAPLTGKTTALRHFVARLEKSGTKAEEILVITPSRLAAAILRDQIALDSTQASAAPRARSISSVAFEILGDRGPIRLLSGAHQQMLLQRLVGEHLATGKAAEWGLSKESVELAGFIQELRDLLAVIIENGLSVEHLKNLQAKYPKLRLGPAIDLLESYREELGLQGLVDSSQLAIAAASEDLTKMPHRFVFVDDAQNLSTGQLRLVEALAAERKLFLFGDPDAATLGFRNSSSAAFLELATKVDASQLELEESESSSCARNLLASLVSRIPATGPIGHRPKASEQADKVVANRFDNILAETDYLAAELRRSRLIRGIEWDQMLVVGRTRTQLEQLARELSSRGVPTRIQGVQRPLREQSMARALLTFVEIALAKPQSKQILELLESPLIGLDALTLRRMLRQLAMLEGFSGLTRSQQLEKAFSENIDIEGLPGRLADLATAISQVRKLASPSAHQVVTIGFGLADRRLAELARGFGPAALAANRNLDSALELFAAAQRWDEREMGEPLEFAKLQLELGIPEDSLAPIGTKPAVVLATPAQISRSYKLVALPRLQEGIWPNLTPRNSLLGATSLQSFLIGRQANPESPARSELADELRMFYRSCGSATELLLLSAISDETEQPSQFFQMARLELTANRDNIDFDLRRVVGRLRRRLLRGDKSAAPTLAAMALAGVPGAHPDSWQGLISQSVEGCLDVSKLRVSASKFEEFEKCPLHWFISNFGGDQGGFQASVGTLLHSALEAASSGTSPSEYLESSWHSMEFESEWQENKSRRQAFQMAGLIAEYLASSAELVAAEKGFRIKLGSLQVTGRIDRIERGADGLEAVDLKTGKRLPKEAQMPSHRQLGIYQLAIESMFEEPSAGGRLVSVGSKNLKTLSQPALTDELRQELSELAGQMHLQLESGEFSARIDEHCGKDGSCQLLIGRVITGG